MTFIQCRITLEILKWEENVKDLGLTQLSYVVDPKLISIFQIVLHLLVSNISNVRFGMNNKVGPRNFSPSMILLMSH